MSTEITIYEQIKDPAAAMVQLGTAIAKSQIFGCQNEAQGQVLALECMAKRLSPLSLAEKYDIIQGKLSMKADAMLAGFEEVGGKYKVISYTSEVCEIEFSRNGSKLKLKITWDDAQQESWPYGKTDNQGNKELKHNWSTPIGRQDMLWARVVSRGVRRLAPGVVCGRYTPEEIGDIDNTPANIQSANVVDSEVVDAVFTPIVVSELKQESEPEKSAASVSPAIDPKPVVGQHASDPCTGDMASTIKKAICEVSQLGAPDFSDKIKAKLKSSGLNVIKDLTILEAEILLQAIKLKSLGEWLSNPVVGHSVNEAETGN